MSGLSGSHNRLNRAQTFKLTKWVEGNLERFAQENTTSNMAAEQATVSMGFPVTQRNILGLAGKSKEAVFEHQWPAGMGNLAAGGGPEGGHANRKLALVIRVVDKLLQVSDMGPVTILGVEDAQLWKELTSTLSSLDNKTTEEPGDGASSEIEADGAK